jgi:hypothetical protein
MSAPAWTEHDSLIAIAARPIVPLALTREAQEVCWMQTCGPRTGSAWEAPDGRHFQAVGYYSVRDVDGRMVAYAVTDYPVLAARFALELLVVGGAG